MSSESAITCLSGPEANDKGSYREADDEVDVYNESGTWFFFQRTDRLLRRRRRRRIIVSLPPSLHPTQPVEGGHQPGLALDAGHRG